MAYDTRLFNIELGFYLTNLKRPCPLIRKHNEHLSTRGDFSFPVNFKYWISYLNVDGLKAGKSSSKTILDYCICSEDSRNYEENSGSDATNRVLDDIVSSSKSWSLVVSKCIVCSDRVQIRLDRKITFERILQIILSKNCAYGHGLPKHKLIALTCNVTQKSEDEMDLSELRVELVKNTTAKLLEVAGYQVCYTCNSSCKCLHFTTKSTDEMETGCQRVVCGVVINNKHHTKESSIKAREYIRQRCDDMQTMAEHKYVSMMEQTSLLKLGDAAVKMDLLNVKPSHIVSLNVGPDSIGNRESSSRGATFALYNCARLAAIQRQFEEKVTSGYYSPLIPFHQVDFSLLSKEEEWELLFVYLLGYPNVIESSVDCMEKGRVSPNLICKFIMDLSSCFSVYYRRVRILTEARSHLLPVMFARLYLLKAIQQVLQNALTTLGISPVLSM